MNQQIYLSEFTLAIPKTINQLNFINLIPFNLISAGRGRQGFILLLVQLFKTMQKALLSSTSMYTFFSGIISQYSMRLTLKEVGLKGKKITVPTPVGSGSNKFVNKQFFLKLIKAAKVGKKKYNDFFQTFFKNIVELNQQKGTLYKDWETSYVLAKQNKFRMKQFYKGKKKQIKKNVIKKASFYYI